MKQRILITVVVAGVILVGILIALHRQQPDHSSSATSPVASTSGVTPDDSAGAASASHPSTALPGTPSANSGAALPPTTPVIERPKATPAVLGQIPQNKGPLPPGPPPLQGLNAVAAQDLDKIKKMLGDYRTVMGENPVGTNAEIMKAIMGGNPKKARLGPPDGVSLNGDGELVDPWGTPFFFHQLSGQLTEIRSAGPDRKLWTGDDIIRK